MFHNVFYQKDTHEVEGEQKEGSALGSRVVLSPSTVVHFDKDCPNAPAMKVSALILTAFLAITASAFAPSTLSSRPNNGVAVEMEKGSKRKVALKVGYCWCSYGETWDNSSQLNLCALPPSHRP